jgi:hypothetical protein
MHLPLRIETMLVTTTPNKKCKPYNNVNGRQSIRTHWKEIEFCIIVYVTRFLMLCKPDFKIKMIKTRTLRSLLMITSMAHHDKAQSNTFIPLHCGRFRWCGFLGPCRSWSLSRRLDALGQSVRSNRSSLPMLIASSKISDKDRALLLLDELGEETLEFPSNVRIFGVKALRLPWCGRTFCWGDML